MKRHEKKKYYFVVYEVYIRGWYPDSMGGASSGSHTTTCQDCINIHPIQFQLDCNKKYEPIFEEPSGHKKSEIYKVLNWKELSKSEYKRFKGYIG